MEYIETVFYQQGYDTKRIIVILFYTDGKGVLLGSCHVIAMGGGSLKMCFTFSVKTFYFWGYIDMYTYKTLKSVVFPCERKTTLGVLP